MQRLHIVAWMSAIAASCYGYPYFKDSIPNGANVPHPCREGDTWQGVGHLQQQGGGDRNVFGLDFFANGKIWDRTLCLKDSDGDGLTNGEELGDPKCVWTVGKKPARKTELSHPGTVNLTIRPPENQVPAQETTYKCYVFTYPTDKDYHMVATEPLIDNVNVMHHLVIFGCGEETDQPVGSVYDCTMEVDSRCKDIIGTWSYGMAGECAHKDMGFRIGQNGYKRGILQYHWNNPEIRADYTDSSGAFIYLTTNLRPNDGGIFVVGQRYLVIPPGEDQFKVNAVCSSECSKTLIKKEVKMAVAFNHMHGLGFSQKMEHIRDGVKLPDITYDAKYDYNSPKLHIHDTPLSLKPGDEIRTECIYKSTSKTKTTFFGKGTADEMCYGFITYYPKENVPKPACLSWQDVTLCAFNVSDVIKGCRFKLLHNLSDPDTKTTYDLVMNNCSPHIGCRKECKPVVTQLKQTSCYIKGTVDDWARMNIEKYASDTVKMMKFYSALDSCDTELAIEATEAKQKKCPDDTTNVPSAASRFAFAGPLIITVLLNMLL